MTNAEKYREVFGIEVDIELCPARSCSECPIGVDHEGLCVSKENNWWLKEYKHSTQININQQK